MFFFWYKPEERANIMKELRRMHREDLIDKLYGNQRTGTPEGRNNRKENIDKRNEHKSSKQRKYRKGDKL